MIRRALKSFALESPSPYPLVCFRLPTPIVLLIRATRTTPFAFIEEPSAPQIDFNLNIASDRFLLKSWVFRKPLKQGLRLFVCMRFQDLFHSPPGVLFAFPSRYWFTIGRSRVFSLGGWSPHLQTGFHVSRPTYRTPSSTTPLSHTGLSPSTVRLSRRFC